MFSTPVFPQPVLPIIPPTRLEWLCQPAQLAETLTRLTALAHWQRARHQLLYADRQGLLDIQAVILGQAWKSGTMRAVAYHDGSPHFPHALRLDSVAARVARELLQHVQSLCEPDLWPPARPEGDHVYQRWIRPLCKRLTGRDCSQVAEAVALLSADHLQRFLQEQLDQLVTHAQQTRRPLPLRALERLCLAPVDLLPIRDNRWSVLDRYDSWDQLVERDYQKLDPEGESHVVFQAVEAAITGSFGLPFRRAARFLALDTIRAFPTGAEEPPGWSPVRVPDPEVLRRFPVTEILRVFGVAVERVCPYHLQEKAAYLAQPSIQRLRWPTNGREQQEWEDDPWDGLVLPPLEAERRSTD